VGEVKTPGQADMEQAAEDAINDIVDCYPQLDTNEILDSQDADAREVLLRYFGRVSAAAIEASRESGDKYPTGWNSAKTLDEILALREACTLRFPHGPHAYELPGPDSLDPEMQQATRDFLFAAHRVVPDMVRDLQARQPPTQPEASEAEQANNERAHCSREAYKIAQPGTQLACDIANTLLSERAATRAECQAEIERLQRAAVPGNGPEMLRMQMALHRAEDEIERLRVRVRSLVENLEEAYTTNETMDTDSIGNLCDLLKEAIQ